MSVRWIHTPTGAIWYEKRVYRTPRQRRMGLPGRVVLGRVGSHTTEVMLYRPEDDPGTGARLLTGPVWRPVVEGCDSCPQVPGVAEIDVEVCPESNKVCGHHCLHSWSHDRCCWCGRTWGEDGVSVAPETAKCPYCERPEGVHHELGCRYQSRGSSIVTREDLGLG